MSEYITIDDAKIRFKRIEGDAEKPTLVFLHEGLGCIEMWKDFPAELCRLTRCSGLLYDRQGFGGSSSLSRKRDINYVHDYACSELTTLVQKLIPNKAHILIGHSDGASIALIYGATEQPRLRGIVSEAAHVFVEEKTIKGIKAADRQYERYGPKGLTKYHGSRTHAVFKGWSITWLSDWFRSWNIEALLPAVKCPVQTIQGADDAYGTIGQIDSICSQVSGQVEPVFIPDCSHRPHHQCPEMALPRMREFIRRIS